MPVDDFAIARGATEPITSKDTASKVWEPRFLAEIIAGRDPRIPPHVPKVAVGVTIAVFLDRYCDEYIEAEGLRDAPTIKSRLKAIKAVIGDLPVIALEKPADILRFKAAYRKGREVATVNRALSTLRAAINWGRFQDPPYLATTPFHRFGVTIKAKEETKGDRRIGLQEERSLLAACSQMGGADHKFVGPAMHDRIIGALETCCRRGEMLRIQTGTAIGSTTRLRFPADTRRTGKTGGSPSIHTGASPRFSNGARPSAPQRTCSAHRPVRMLRASRRHGSRCCCSRTATTRRARSAVRASTEPSCGRSTCTGTTFVTRGLSAPERWSGHPHDSADARPRRHQADAAVPEHHGRRTAEGDDRGLGAPSPAQGGGPVQLSPTQPRECP
jgi:hypothetical protein